MRLGPPLHRKIMLDDKEQLFFTSPGSEVRGRSPLSLVGGHVYVTSSYLAFTPNYFAAVFGRRPKLYSIVATDERIETIKLGFPLGDTAVLRATCRGSKETLVLMVKNLEDLQGAIKLARTGEQE